MTSPTDTQTIPYVTNHARHDPGHCLAGIYRCLERGAKKPVIEPKEHDPSKKKKLYENLDVTYQFGDESMHFQCIGLLGVDDLRVNLGLVALASDEKVTKCIKPESESRVGKALRGDMSLSGKVAGEDVIVVRFKFRQFLREIGLAGSGFNILRLKASIKRFASMLIEVRKGAEVCGFHMLSYYFDDETEEMVVALNPRISRAVFGGDGVRYAHISMSEVRALKHDPSILILFRLSAWVNKGATQRVGMDTLCGYCWPEENQDLSVSAQKKRRLLVRRALQELENLGWGVEEIRSGQYRITRPD